VVVLEGRWKIADAEQMRFLRALLVIPRRDDIEKEEIGRHCGIGNVIRTIFNYAKCGKNICNRHRQIMHPVQLRGTDFVGRESMEVFR
jgi:hypothetical protein